MTVAPTMTTKSRTSKSQVGSSKKNTQILLSARTAEAGFVGLSGSRIWPRRLRVS